MDNEMIERCIKAASDAAQQEEEYCSKAMVLSIIKAMREPTEKMKIAGSIDPGSGGPDDGYETEIYQAMLDAIIGDK